MPCSAALKSDFSLSVCVSLCYYIFIYNVLESPENQDIFKT